MQLKRTQSPTRQSGAALVVGLILLLVLTILAISTMGTSTTEVVMAQNARYSANAFQAAETAIDSAIASGAWNTNQPFVVAPTAAPDGDSQLEYDITYDQATAVPTGGFSMGSGTGFLAYHFDITSVGTSLRNATSTHSQSFYVVGPGGN